MIEGEHIDYYKSGEILSKSWHLDGKLNGESIRYYESGELGSKINYLDGNLHGESISYLISGKIVKYYYIYGKSVTELEWLSYDRNIKLELIGL